MKRVLQKMKETEKLRKHLKIVPTLIKETSVPFKMTQGPPEAQVARAVAAIREALQPAGVSAQLKSSFHASLQ